MMRMSFVVAFIKANFEMEQFLIVLIELKILKSFFFE